MAPLKINLQDRLQIASLVAAALAILLMLWLARRAERIAERQAQEFVNVMNAFLARLGPRVGLAPVADPERGHLWEGDVITHPEPVARPPRAPSSGQAAAAARGDPVELSEFDSQPGRPVRRLPSLSTEPFAASSLINRAVVRGSNPPVVGQEEEVRVNGDPNQVSPESPRDPRMEAMSVEGGTVADRELDNVVLTRETFGRPGFNEFDADETSRVGRANATDGEASNDAPRVKHRVDEPQLSSGVHAIVEEHAEIEPRAGDGVL